MSAQQPMSLAALRDLQRLIVRLNQSTDLPRTLQRVVDGVVEGLGFGAAVVNLVRSDGRLEVVAAAGSDEVAGALLGKVGERADWDAALAAAQTWGALRYLPHDAWQAAETLPGWVPDAPVLEDPLA